MGERGRPVRFPQCPECGQDVDGLRLYGVRKAGSCISVYCTCSVCGIRLRYVISGKNGFWVRVKREDDE